MNLGTRLNEEESPVALSGVGRGEPLPQTESGSQRSKSVAIIIRVMDRATELRISLPSLLSQDYPNYHVVVVDHSSRDDLPDVLAAMASPRLRVVRCPRPAFFNRSRAANIGVRYSFSDLLFFLDTGIAFRDEHHLSEIVAAFDTSSEADGQHYKIWRQQCGYPPLNTSFVPRESRARKVYSECECHGLHLLVGREIFQRIGGLNEALQDWGYEDTDLTTRLELCGYQRIAIRELVEQKHEDDIRLRFHREKRKEQSWMRNRRISDGLINSCGPVLRAQPIPGATDTIEIDGVSFVGAEAPQQDWTLPTAAEGTKSRSSTLMASGPGTQPTVSVVVPTKNAAEYLPNVLDSILSQEYPFIECLVIDGGSTDATLDILASYGDRITWETHSDRGAFDAINRGWQKSCGQILAWLNADDAWAPGAVTAAVNCFQEDPKADVIYGNCSIVDADGRELERRRPPDWDLGYAVECCHHIIDQPAAFIRRDMVERVGWLYPAWFHDWDLFRRVSLAGGQIKRVSHWLGCARVRADNTQYRPEILIDGLIAMTNRFFSLPGVPVDLQELKPRAISNSYLRIMQALLYGRPEDRALHLKLRLKALIADPSNLPNIRTGTPVRGGVPASLQNAGEFARATVVGNDQSLPTAVTRDRAKASSQLFTVSVVVPCKNDARYLPFTLESILSQGYPALECIVVDGGSTDGTLDILKSYGDRIRWLSEPDRGAFDAINRGWQLSKGEILTWLNADDLWAPGALNIVTEFFQRRPGVDVLFGTAGVVDEQGRFLGDLVPQDWNLEHALLQCFHVIYQPASFMRRRILERVGWLYPAWCHDHDLWLRIAQAGGTFEKVSVRLGVDRARPENLGHLSELIIPAKIALTKRFFAAPNLAPNVRRLRHRAVSSAYVRAFDYLQVGQRGHWFWGLKLAVQAFAADPSNIASITERATRALRWRAGRLRDKVPSRILVAAGAVAKVGRGVTRFLIGVVLLIQLLGRAVARVFRRDNRTVEQSLESIAARLDAMANQIPQLARYVETLRRQHETDQEFMTQAVAGIAGPIDTCLETITATLPQVEARLGAVERAIPDAFESLRAEIEAAQKRPPTLSSALRDVYGAPPALQPIPGWHTYWGIENQSNRFHADRLALWESLKSPVLMRWLADLLVMILPGNELSRVLFLTGNFEPSELTWMSHTLTEGMTVIDVGAHMGMYTMVASKLVGDSGVVVALEPSTREYQRLAFHVAVNDLRNTLCLQAAGSSVTGHAELKVASEFNSGHNTFGEFFNSSVETVRIERVQTQTLDDVVAAQRLSRVDFIKIDVEGHECQVLAGAVETLQRFRPKLLIEVSEQTLARQGSSARALLGFVQEHGYILHEFSEVDGTLVPLERPVDTETRNVVALPQ